jgi:mannosyltransferase
MVRVSVLPLRSIVRLFLLTLTLLAFAWRVQGLTQQSLWRDEVDAIYFALRELSATLSMFVDVGQNGPLYFVALRPWFWLVGASEYALRWPSAAFGTLSVPLLWQVTRLFFTKRPQDQSPAQSNEIAIGLLAATFFAFNPYQLWYGQEGKMYSLITALALLATWCWLRGIQRGGWRPWLGYWFVVSIAMYCHLLMIMLIPLHMLWFLIAWPQSRQHWRGYGLALAGLTLPYLPMVWWQWDLLMATDQRTAFSFTPWSTIVRTLLYNHSRGFLPNDEMLLLVPIFFLALIGLGLGIGELSASSAAAEGDSRLAAWRRWLLLVTWLLFPPVEIYLLSLRQPVFTDRYIIWIAPAAMILLAMGAVILYHASGHLRIPLVTLLVGYILTFWLYAGWQQKTLPMKYDLRSAVTYTHQRRAPETLLILQIPHMEWSYRYYTGNFQADLFANSDERLGWWAGGLWTNRGAPDDQARAEVDRQMRQITVGANELWVLRSEVEMWDARHLMDEWLDQHGTVLEQAEFHGAQVKHYVLTTPVN